MPLSFPSSPTTGQTSTQNGRTYSWTDYAWELVASGGGGSGEDTLLRSLLVPPAPTGVSASAGNAQATVSWTAPTGVIAQAPVTDYSVQFQPAGGSWQPFSDGTSTATSATVTGLTNGTAYQFRVAAVNAVGTGSYSTASSAVTPVAGDPLWSSVQLLLPGDTSTNDVSSYNRSVSALGGAAVSTSEKKFGAGSIFTDGSGDSITSTASSFAFGTGDFTVEMWLRPRAGSSSNYARIAQCGNFPSSGGWQLVRGTASGGGSSNPLQLMFDITNGDSSAFRIEGGVVADDVWSHVALVRDSGVVRIYVNGQQTAFGSSSYNLTQTTICFGGNTTGGDSLFAYFDDVRVTSVCRYPGGSTFTVPTAAFPTVGPSGVATDGYFSSVSLLLHADGTGSTFVDSSPTPKSIAAINATQSATQSRWGGKSAEFDGSTGHLTIPDTSSLSLSGDFTIECWVRLNGYSQLWGDAYGSVIVSRYQGVGSGDLGWLLALRGSASAYTELELFTGVTGLSFPHSFNLNQWYYIAVSRSSNTIRAYVNGEQIGSSITNSDGFTPTNSRAISIGRNALEATYKFNLNGFLDDLRITKGSARGYTGETIQVPTAAFPDSGNYTYTPIPLMTSATTPSGVASASAILSSGLDAWKAFDKAVASGDTTFYASAAGAPQWLQYDYGSVSSIGGYEITSRQLNPFGSTQSPVAWTLSGSNDGTTFTTIETRSAQSFAGPGETKRYFLASVASYRIYRWTWTDFGPDAENAVVIPKLQVF
jgi:hypothetical protein